MQKKPQGSKHISGALAGAIAAMSPAMPQLSKGTDPAWHQCAGELPTTPWDRTSLWVHRASQVVEGKTDTTAVQGFETGPGKASGREQPWPGQGRCRDRSCW